MGTMTYSEKLSRVWRELRRAWAITKKDARIYYLRPGTLMFGLMFPFFLFISFAVGRNLPPEVLIPGLMAITIFFSSSSVGPMAVPTERKTKTYERMITAPISPLSILLGEIAGGAVFGIITVTIPLIISMIWYDTRIVHPLGFIAAIALISFEFSAMGIMFSAIPTENPGDVMMILNFIRLPLIFVSGIFIPIDQMGKYGILTVVSPLTYAKDMIQYTVSGNSFYGLIIDSFGIIVFTALFIWIGVSMHERSRKRG
jgi:ABC-2 type transport system permease protein